jgi:hypothetical protein
MNHYLSVFHTADDITTEIRDLGDDPFFSDEFATWGICRPQVRAKWVKVGTQIIFIGYHKKTDVYYLKGFFKVGEKVDLIEALRRYPRNKNVIISKTNDKEENNSWRDKRKKKMVLEKFGEHIPEFLKTINFKGEEYRQNKVDSHEIDNWKCQRIFLCNFKQFCKCVKEGNCEKENTFDVQRGYAIASEWEDYSRFRLQWTDVYPESFKSRSLRTPKFQHNVMKISHDDIIELKKNIEREIEKENTAHNNN